MTGVGAGAMKLGAARLSEFAPYLREHGWLLPALLLPAAGLAGAFLLGRLLLRRRPATSLSWVISDLQEKQPEMSWLETFSHIFTSAVTVGLGSSAGLETPSVLTGAAIGSKTGWLCRLSVDKRGTLMVCGTAAGSTPKERPYIFTETVSPSHCMVIPLRVSGSSMSRVRVPVVSRVKCPFTCISR